jgi:3-oxoacyl-[acyl-carrier protein] reductase
MMQQASVSSEESQSVTSVILEGQVALVTGASRGIGLAVAKRLASLGAHVCICARDARQLDEAKAEIERARGRVIAVAADVSHSGDVAKLIEKAVSALGPVQILVNNAGIGYFAPMHEAPEEKWDAVMDTNLKSVFLVSKAVAPGMIQKRGGHIINIASIAGKSAFAGGGIYCASKWGVLGLTQCMAEDLRPQGIRVSVICPGSVNTDFSPHTGKDVSKMLQPDDIAHAVETLVTQQPQSFISEMVLRPTQKP